MSRLLARATGAVLLAVHASLPTTFDAGQLNIVAESTLAANGTYVDSSGRGAVATPTTRRPGASAS